MPKLLLTQAGRKGTREDPFVDDNVVINIEGLPTGEAHPGNSYWVYSLRTVSGRSANDRIGPPYSNSENWANDDPHYGPSVLTIWNFSDRYKDELLVLTVTSHKGTTCEQTASVYLIDAKYADGAVSVPEPPTPEPPQPDPTDLDVKIFCAGDQQLMISKQQRDKAVADGDLTLFNPGTYMARYETSWTREQFLSVYPYPTPEPEYNFPQQINLVRPPERLITIKQGRTEIPCDVWNGGIPWTLLRDGHKQVFTMQGLQNRELGGVNINFDLYNGERRRFWDQDPLPDSGGLNTFNPTLGGGLYIPEACFPVDYEHGSDWFHGISQMPDFGGVTEPQTDWYKAKQAWSAWMCDWFVKIVDEDNILFRFSFWHEYNEPQKCTKYTWSYFLDAQYFDRINRASHGIDLMDIEYLSAEGEKGKVLIYTPDIREPRYIGQWLVGEVGNITGMVAEAEEPPDAYAAHFGIRWTLNRVLQPGEKVETVVAVNLAADLGEAKHLIATAGQYQPEEPELETEYRYFGPVQTDGEFETRLVITTGQESARFSVFLCDESGQFMEDGISTFDLPAFRRIDEGIHIPKGSRVVYLESDAPLHVYGLVYYKVGDRVEYISDYRLERI